MRFNTLSGFLVALLWSVGVYGGDDDDTRQLQDLVDNLCHLHQTSQGHYNSGRSSIKGFCRIYLQCDPSHNRLELCPVGFFFGDFNGCAVSHEAYCPYDPCIGKEDGYVRTDEETCGGFFICVGNLSYHRPCDNGFRFSPSGCVADKGCGKKFQIGEILSKEDKYTDSACDDNQYLVSPYNLESYFERVPGGNYIKRSCPPGLLFDRSTCNCKHPDDDGKTQTDQCVGKKDGFSYGDGETCGGFVVCLEERSNNRQCDDGFRFSSTGCVPDHTCRNHNPVQFRGCDKYQYLATPQFPGVYFQRVPGGDYIERPCPAGLVFDTTVCVCNYPGTANSEKWSGK